MRHAAGLNRIEDREDARDALSQFQGTLALLDRARRARSLPPAAAARLAASAAAVRLDEGRGYEGRMARWVAGELLPALGALPPAARPDPSAATGAGHGSAPRERIVLQALAGALEDDGRSHRRTTTWEGFPYVADLRGATLARLLEARRLQSGASLDAALDLWAIADALAAGPDPEEAERLARSLSSLGDALPGRPGPVGAVTVPDYLALAHEDLERVGTPGGRSRRAAEAAPALLRLADAVLGDVLRALVYAAHIGDPRSGVLGSGDLSGRHEFGLDPYYRDPLRATAWRFPVPRMLADRPWHAEGALLGLDLATATLRLQQIMTNQPPVTSALGSHERGGLAASVAFFNPYGRTESETREIARALEAGRQRVARLAESPDEVAAVAATAGLGRRRFALLAWTANREPDRLGASLSLRELLWLGLEETGARDSGGGRDCRSRAPERLGRLFREAGRLSLSPAGAATAQVGEPAGACRHRPGGGAGARPDALGRGGVRQARAAPVPRRTGRRGRHAIHARPGPAGACGGLEHGPALPIHAAGRRLRGLRLVADRNGPVPAGGSFHPPALGTGPARARAP